MIRRAVDADSRYIKAGPLWVNRAWQGALERAGLGTFEALMKTEGAGAMTKQGLAAWRQRVRLSVEGQALFLKRYFRAPGRGRSPALGEYDALRAVEAAGAAVPEVVAVGEQRDAHGDRQSVLVLAAAPGWSLQQWASDRPDLLKPAGRRAALSNALARTVGRLHGAGLFHRDLYLSHIFAHEHDDGTFALTLIDLARVIRPRLFSLRWRVKDLAALHYSTPVEVAGVVDRVRWYKRYRGIARLRRRDRWLLRWIEMKAKRIARHTDRHGLNGAPTRRGTDPSAG